MKKRIEKKLLDNVFISKATPDQVRERFSNIYVGATYFGVMRSYLCTKRSAYVLNF